MANRERHACMATYYGHSVNNPQRRLPRPALLPLLQSIHILTSSLGCGYNGVTWGLRTDEV